MGDVREAAHGWVDRGEGGGGDGDQMRTCRLVGQMAHHVRPASVSHGSQNTTIMHGLPVLRRAYCAGPGGI